MAIQTTINLADMEHFALVSHVGLAIQGCVLDYSMCLTYVCLAICNRYLAQTVSGMENHKTNGLIHIVYICTYISKHFIGFQ